jgi:hypothetical protein
LKKIKGVHEMEAQLTRLILPSEVGLNISMKAGWPFDALFCQKNSSDCHQKCIK